MTSRELDTARLSTGGKAHNTVALASDGVKADVFMATIDMEGTSLRLAIID